VSTITSWVEIRGFGTFTVRERAARKGRNPRTGESVQVPAIRYLHFKPGKEMREQVDRMNAEEEYTRHVRTLRS